MNSTASRTHRKACARCLKNASHSGRIDKTAQRASPPARKVCMDDPRNIPEAGPPEELSELRAPLDLQPNAQPAAETTAELAPAREPAWPRPPSDLSREGVASHRRSFRHNLVLLLSLTLAAFILTAWVLVRADSPFGIFSTGPQ